MPFKTLPKPLQLFLLAQMPAVLLAAVVMALLDRGPSASPMVIGVLLLLSAVFSTWKVELTVFNGQMTMTFAIVTFALLQVDPLAAVACAGFGALVGSMLKPVKGSWKVTLIRRTWYQVYFNVTNCAVSCALATMAYLLVRRGETGLGYSLVPALFTFTLVYYLANTGGVSAAIALQKGQRWVNVWTQSFLWTAPGFFASACLAAGIVFAVRIWGWGNLFLLLPPIYCIYFSYRIYLERVQLLSDKLKQEMSHIQELNRLNQSVIASLATAIDAKDRYTCSHINRVQQYAITLAEAAQLEPNLMQAVITGALVHDIGKLGVPDHILGKPGRLSPDEYERIKAHVQIGAEILSPVQFPFPVVDVVLTHHERWDGLGYPKGLSGEEIPVGGRIISIVDVFDALTSDRPYRRALSHEDALQVLRDGAGKQFDPQLVELFAQVHAEACRRIQVMEEAVHNRPEDATHPVTGSFALTRISEAAAEMATVSFVAHSLADQETVQGVAEVVLKQARELVPTDTLVFYSLERESLRMAAVTGLYEERLDGLSMDLGEGVAGWVARHNRARVNVSAAPDVARRFGPDDNLELAVVTAVPVIHGEQTLGVLAAYASSYTAMNEHHVHLLGILAEHAASALQNVRRIERNRELADTDPLTGLANSRSLIRKLDRLVTVGVAERNAGETITPFSLLMLDLDHFKEVNDTLGHIYGDDLLRHVAQALSSVARPSDTVSRYAGDEFVMLLPGCGPEEAAQVARRAQNAVAAMVSDLSALQVGASAGLATLGADGWSSRELLHAADQRMYEDKFHRRSPLAGGSRSTGSSARPTATLTAA